MNKTALPPASAVADLGPIDYVTRGAHKHLIVELSGFVYAAESILRHITPPAVSDAAREVTS